MDMTGEPARVAVVVLDCADLDRSATFWCGVLGYVAESGNHGRRLPAPGNAIRSAGGTCVGRLMTVSAPANADSNAG